MARDRSNFKIFIWLKKIIVITQYPGFEPAYYNEMDWVYYLDLSPQITS